MAGLGNWEMISAGHEQGTGRCALRCLLVRLTPMSAVVFATDLPPDWPERHENPVARARSRFQVECHE